ncbi:MAG: hypothetical protein EA420_03105 [Candidatus Competibacteraceae bacterium]|nr:MAG: hypothetical protein EA420_03105 [Candidatus Competibacteraceae bacterium]
MPIQEQNIQFLKHQVMDDVPEGGGAATGTAIPDGVMNNVFEDISDLDRAIGRLNLRKISLAVRSLSTDLYAGAKTIITRMPADPDINYTLFTTNDPFDTRVQAAGRVEAYLYKGPMWPGALNENHIIGMRAISVIQRVNSALPPIGKTLTLVQNEGLGNEQEQYVRVIGVEAVTTTFTDNQGDFQRWIVTLDLSDALRFNFNGHTVNRTDTYNYTGKTRLRDTTVADATRYYGSHPVAAAAEIGDLQIKAASIFGQLVPSARTETPLVNQAMNPDLIQTINAGTRTVEVPQQAHTRALAVTAENRRLNWIETLAPRPAPNTLSISYRAQGNWYTLTATGGIISGSDPAFGAGALDPTTDIAAVTLGALPDAGSQIMYVWASAVHYAVRVGNPDIDLTLEIQHSVDEPIKPGTLVLTWLQGGVEKTATAAASGAITGHATGYAAHGVGEFWLRFSVAPDANSLLGIDYERVTQVQQTFTGVSAPGGIATVDLAATVEPGSVTVKWSTQSTTLYDSTASDNTWRRVDGEWTRVILRAYVHSQGRVRRYEHQSSDDGAGAIIGAGSAINYSSGELTLPLLPVFSEHHWSTETVSWGSTSSSTVHTFVSGVVNVWYTPAGATPTAVSTEIPLPDLQFRILPRLLDETVVPGSVRFAWNGQTYNDFNGTLYRSNDTIIAGTLNYLSGIVSLSDYVSGAGAVTVSSLLTRFGQWSTVEASFRTALAPLVPEALGIVAVTTDGEQITGSADENGAISGTAMTGVVDYEVGVARIQFGSGSDPFVPRAVDPGTIRYNAVAYSYIPLDADILGIDAVRLPPDGRVPIYRKGDVVMIVHEQTTAPLTPTEDTGFVIGYEEGVPLTATRFAVSVGRTRIGWVKVFDDDGATVTEGYDVDRANGKVGFTTLSGLATPITVRHTVGDLRLVTDAQIDGTLTLARALSHPFPAGESLVCAALLHGDRRARVSLTWDQASWNGTWVDFLDGSAATATLNLIDYPITVTNEGTDTDRWLFRVTNAASNQWELISEKRGLVWAGTYAPDGAAVAPINRRTRVWDEGSQAWVGGTPYLVIPGAANGGGWATGNVVRINTVGAIADFWIARAIGQSEAPLDDGADGCEIYALGNIDRP